MINEHGLNDIVIVKSEYIPDEEVEIYLKASDLLVIPYKFIFQTGVLFLSYNFGLPVIATDVGSLREDIVEGKTGFLCKPEDPQDLSDRIDFYFQSDLYKNLDANRLEIIKYANEKYSWASIGKTTVSVYEKLIEL